MDKRIEDGRPYFLLEVQDPDDPNGQEMELVYIDTSEQGMLYDPETFTSNYRSNLSGMSQSNQHTFGLL